VSDLDVNTLRVWLGDGKEEGLVAEKGGCAASYVEEAGFRSTIRARIPGYGLDPAMKSRKSGFVSGEALRVCRKMLCRAVYSIAGISSNAAPPAFFESGLRLFECRHASA